MNCRRKAGWTYFMGYPDLGNFDTELGTHVHAVLEDIGKTGRLPDLMSEVEAIAAEALPYVQSMFGPETKFEGEIRLQGRHAWTGFVDVRPRRGMKLDYKTTGDFKWAKTPEDLLVDPQGMLYAEHEFRACPDLSEVHLLWLYLRKRKPYAAKPVVAQVTRDHAARAFAALESYADEMQAAAFAAPDDPVARHKHVLELAPNFDHCSAYRGCPHRARCPDSPLFSPNRGGTTMNLLERLTQMTAQVDAGVSPLPAAPPTLAPALAPALLPTPGGNPHPMGARSDMPPANDEAPINDMADAAHMAINPPKRGPGRPRKAPAATAPATPAAPPATSSNSLDALAAAMAAPDPEPAFGQPIIGTNPVVSQYRIQKGEIAPFTVEENLALAASPPAPAPAPGLIQTLFVGCRPLATSPAAGNVHRDLVDTVEFDAVFAKAKEMLTEPVYYANYGYKSNGMLLQNVQKLVEHMKPTALVVAYMSPEANLCLSYLRSVAQVTVEAVR